MPAHTDPSKEAPAFRALSWDFEEQPPFDDIEQYVNELLVGRSKGNQVRRARHQF